MLKHITLFLFSYFYLSLSFSAPLNLAAIETTLTAHGKSIQVYDIVQPDGTQGFSGKKGEFFDVILKNKTKVPISIHWHGLIVPNDQDGVPYVTQLPIQPGQSHHYYFKLLQAGTFWMHSHYKLHEQRLMTAPFIVSEKKSTAQNEMIIMLQEFTTKTPEQIFAELKHPKNKMDMNTSMPVQPDLNDVQYEAYLANRKTLGNSEVKIVKAGEKLRLRIINASSATNFWIDTGKLTAKALAVDGNNIIPFSKNRFQLAVAQRIDLEVTIPAAGGTFPILAQVEGLKNRTGVILTTSTKKPASYSEMATNSAPPLDDKQEYQLHAQEKLPAKPINAVLNYKLTGDMQRYIWKINDEVWPHIKPSIIKNGDRVAMVFTNNTDMAHPMHFHGHVFQVTAINDKPLVAGPLRDTILVLPHSSKTIVFDANNPGIWVTHCHVLYHMEAGMMTTANYSNYTAPRYYQDLINGKIKDD